MPFTILQNTRRAVLADHNIGEAADKHDRTWARTVLTDRLGEQAHLVVPEPEPATNLVLCSLIGRMIRAEAGALASVASHAD